MIIKLALLVPIVAFTYIVGPLIDLPHVSDPWFVIFILWWLFSAVTTGMPEPEEKSSFFYVWAYRTFHVIAGNGTSYFADKTVWPIFKREKGTGEHEK